MRWNLYLDEGDKKLIEVLAKEAGVSPSRFLSDLAREEKPERDAEAVTAGALRAKLKRLRGPSGAAVVNDSGETVVDGEVVERRVRPEPETVLEHRQAQLAEQRGFDDDGVAADDPRLLLPRPEFDPARRKSEFPPYVSPRPGRYRVPYGARKAAGFLSLGQRSPASELESVSRHTFHRAED